MSHKFKSILVLCLIPLFLALTSFVSLATMRAVTQNCFTDVTTGMWFHDYVCWMFDKGLTTGYPDGTYRPLNPVTRAEMAVFLQQISGEGSIGPIVDADKLDGLDAGDLYTQAEVDSLLASYDARISALEDLLASVSTENSGQDVVFTGVNVHVRDGSGDTDGAVNGRGNLIVGYNSAGINPFDTDSHNGSHNLIIGDEHSYASYGGFAVGYDNILTGIGASITGGRNNTAGPGAYASVSGGQFNTASGTFSAVAGGLNNTATGATTTVSGGQENLASGSSSNVSGGYQRSAVGNRHWMAGSLLDNNSDAFVIGANLYVQNGSGMTWNANGKGNLIIGYNLGTLVADTDVQTGSHNLVVGEDHSFTSWGGLVAGLNNNITFTWASVSGGYNNTASGSAASVSGGHTNLSSGNQTSVCGGNSNVASGLQASVTGGRENTASGGFSSVSGGYGNLASYSNTTVSGGSSNTAADLSSSISGGQGCTIPFSANERGWAVGNFHTGSGCVLKNGW